MMKMKRGWTLQGEDAPKHSQGNAQRKKIKLLERPGQSSDPNPADDLQKELRLKKGPHVSLFVWKNGPKSPLNNACSRFLHTGGFTKLSSPTKAFVLSNK